MWQRQACARRHRNNISRCAAVSRVWRRRLQGGCRLYVSAGRRRQALAVEVLRLPPGPSQGLGDVAGQGDHQRHARCCAHQPFCFSVEGQDSHFHSVTTSQCHLTSIKSVKRQICGWIRNMPLSRHHVACKPLSAPRLDCVQRSSTCLIAAGAVVAVVRGAWRADGSHNHEDATAAA